MSNLLVLLRESLPEFFGSLSAAAVVTTAAAAALRAARTARLRRRDPAPTEPTPPWK